jgi:hypothetical protein
MTNPDYVVNARSVVDGGYHYMVNRSDGWKILFHWASDPHEEHQLAPLTDYRGILDRLNKLLREYEHEMPLSPSIGR